MRRSSALATLLKLLMSVDARFSRGRLSTSEKYRRGAKALGDELWAVFLPKSPCGCSAGACGSLRPGTSADNHLLSRPSIVRVGEYSCSLVFYAVRVESEFGLWFP